ncbi:MAG: hypothetical protein IH956_10545 [Chloroflexi bacterium]|nr:hypothetical protein [Chloroflexota bacterium]
MVAESDENFEISKELGFTIHGLGNKYRRRAQRMQPNDRLLFYVTQLRKWTVTATITSHSFVEHKPIWKSSRQGDDYPYRVRLSPDIVLDEEDYIDAGLLAPGLEYLKRWLPEDWPLAFYDKLHLLPQRDFALVEGEMKRIVSRQRRNEDATAEPVDQPQSQPQEPGDHREADAGPTGEDREGGTAEPMDQPLGQPQEPPDHREADPGPTGEDREGGTAEPVDQPLGQPQEPPDHREADAESTDEGREAAF